MRIDELRELSIRDWIELTGRDRVPFGPEVADVAWRPKEQSLGLWHDGRLVAAGGLVRARVEVAGAAFEVVGVGGIVVAPEWRGKGLLSQITDPLSRLADTLGPDFAMLFCREPLVRVYAARGYHRIADPVTVDQPGGRITMPIPAMWRPLRPGAAWPKGPVAVEGEPF